MKVITPEISWHEREPIYSIDFQHGNKKIQRLASGGVDKIVRIWRYNIGEGKEELEFLSNLKRHTASVNSVRFSRNGDLLASAADDNMIILWKLSEITSAPNIFNDDDTEEDKETWVSHKTLRGHLGDVADLCWSSDSRYLISGSVDNSAVVWDIVKEQRLAVFSDHKSYVQGVAFDPLGEFVTTLSADRSMRIFNLKTKGCTYNVNKMTFPAQAASVISKKGATADGKPKPFRIFHDDSFRSFFRRLEFSRDGQILVAPAGCMEIGDKTVNASFVFARKSISKPAMYLPSAVKTTTAVRVCPQTFELRPPTLSIDGTEATENNPQSVFKLSYRIVFAVATEDSVLIYDTQQTMPIGLVKNIHYDHINDMTWSEDGRSLVVCSTDGFCTVICFEKDELGIPYQKKADQEIPSLVKNMNQANIYSTKSPEESQKAAELSVSNNKEKSPVDKTNKKSPKQKLEKSPFDKKTNKKSPTQKLEKSPNAKFNESTEKGKVDPLINETNGVDKNQSNLAPDDVEMKDDKPKDTEKQKEITEKNNTNTPIPKEELLKKNETKPKKRIQFTTISLKK